MRNHDHKARDMARSVLPSTARKGAREARAIVHGRERAHERQVLHHLRRCLDPEDYDGDLGVSSRHRGDVSDMVDDRRGADKVGPLVAWAERLVQRDPALLAATPEDREVHFRKILPPGLIGNHAIVHLWWVLDEGRGRWSWNRTSTVSAGIPDVEVVEGILAAGGHAELNRRLRTELDRVVSRTVWLPPQRLIDDDHPAPGVLLPSRRTIEHRRRHIRFLAGAHDVVAFVEDADWEVLRVARALHAEIGRL